MKPHDKTTLAEYYAKRASHYDEVYAKPERQADLAALKQRLRETVAGQTVFELACGTGYWTEELAQTATTVLATDINPEMLALAQARNLPAGKVSYALADANDVKTEDGVKGRYGVCFAGFFWSHVKRDEQGAFLAQLGDRLGAGTMLVLIDNIYVEGSSTSIARTDLDGNTYQIRTLASGERFEVLKNFPTDSTLRKKLAASVRDIRITRVAHYWMLTGRLK
ncbi:MAG: class I SAM-dependent methyltransferase [Janthinobacterium lividum]